MPILVGISIKLISEIVSEDVGYIITSAKGGYVFGRVGLFPCLSAALLRNSTRDFSRAKEQSI